MSTRASIKRRVAKSGVALALVALECYDFITAPTLGAQHPLSARRRPVPTAVLLQYNAATGARRRPAAGGYGAGRAATILVAECVGTGVLALPYVASVLGTGPFLLFVAVQVALNLYAGELLATAAEMSERRTNYEACRSTTSALWDFVDDADNIDWDTGEPKSPTTRPRDMLELAQGLDAGRPLRALVACAWYGNLVLILAQYLVVMARSLRVAFPLPGCAVVESLLIAALTAWLIAQLPTLDALGKGPRGSSASEWRSRYPWRSAPSIRRPARRRPSLLRTRARPPSRRR